jgi:hypothetical protein
MITVYDNDNKPPRWKSWEDIGEWHYDGFSLGGAVTYRKPTDEFEFPYHAVMIDDNGDEGEWLALHTFEAARLWIESQDFAAHARNLSDQSALADLPEDYFQ